MRGHHVDQQHLPIPKEEEEDEAEATESQILGQDEEAGVHQAKHPWGEPLHEIPLFPGDHQGEARHQQSLPATEEVLLEADQWEELKGCCEKEGKARSGDQRPEREQARDPGALAEVHPFPEIQESCLRE